MEVIMRPRGGGKTIELMKKVVQHNGIMMVQNQYVVDRLENMYPVMKGRITTYNSLHNKYNGWPISKVWIDDIEPFLYQFLAGSDVRGFSITGQEQSGWDS